MGLKAHDYVARNFWRVFEFFWREMAISVCQLRLMASQCINLSKHFAAQPLHELESFTESPSELDASARVAVQARKFPIKKLRSGTMYRNHSSKMKPAVTQTENAKEQPKVYQYSQMKKKSAFRS